MSPRMMIVAREHTTRLLAALCAEGWKLETGKPSVEFVNRRIRLKAIILDPVDYATALHEVGHTATNQPQWCDQYQRYVWQCEVAAWRWARRNAVQWTAAMQQHATRCLASYQRTCEQRKQQTQRKGGW